MSTMMTMMTMMTTMTMMTHNDGFWKVFIWTTCMRKNITRHAPWFLCRGPLGPHLIWRKKLPKANWLGNQTRVHLACLKFFWEAEAINVRDRGSSWSGHYTSFLVVIIQLNPRCSAWEKWKVKLSQKLDSVKLSRIITVSYGTRWNSRMV